MSSKHWPTWSKKKLNVCWAHSAIHEAVCEVVLLCSYLCQSTPSLCRQQRRVPPFPASLFSLSSCTFDFTVFHLQTPLLMIDSTGIQRVKPKSLLALGNELWLGVGTESFALNGDRNKQYAVNSSEFSTFWVLASTFCHSDTRGQWHKVRNLT